MLLLCGRYQEDRANVARFASGTTTGARLVTQYSSPAREVPPPARDVSSGHYTGGVKYIAALVAVAALMGGLRWWLLSTLARRHRRQGAEAPARKTVQSRLIALARWPIFLILCAGAVALGLLAGVLVGPH